MPACAEDSPTALPRRLASSVALTRSCHPGPTVVVTAVAGALAATTGRDPGGVAAVVAAVLAGQLTIGWHNDFLDAARDARSERGDKPIVAGAISRSTVGRGALVAGVAVIPLSFLSGVAAGSVHLVAVASGLSYNSRLRATAFSAVPFALSFGLLPLFVTLGERPPEFAPWWFSTTGALLGVGAHLTNTLPDLEHDKSDAIRGLPHRLGRARALSAAAAALLLASVVLAVGPSMPGWWRPVAPAIATALVIALALAARKPGSRLPFVLTMLIAVLDVALLVAAGPRLT